MASYGQMRLLREYLNDISDRGVQCGIKLELALTTQAACNVTRVDELDHRFVHI